MSEKIIDEVMELVKYACDSYAHLSWCKDNAEPTEAIKEELKQDLEAIRAKLREVLDRKPLTDEQIEQATGTKIGQPLFLAAKGFVQATERAHGIGS